MGGEDGHKPAAFAGFHRITHPRVENQYWTPSSAQDGKLVQSLRTLLMPRKGNCEGITKGSKMPQANPQARKKTMTIALKELTMGNVDQWWVRDWRAARP